MSSRKYWTGCWRVGERAEAEGYQTGDSSNAVLDLRKGLRQLHPPGEGLPNGPPRPGAGGAAGAEGGRVSRVNVATSS